MRRDYILSCGEVFELLPTSMVGCPSNGTNLELGWTARIKYYDGDDGKRRRYRVEAKSLISGEVRNWWIYEDQLAPILDSFADASNDLSILI